MAFVTSTIALNLTPSTVTRFSPEANGSPTEQWVYSPMYVDSPSRGRFVDFHSLRMSYNMVMAGASISGRVRQHQMRHTDPRLTENTYVDEVLLPVTRELEKMPWIGRTRASTTTQNERSGVALGVASVAKEYRKTVLYGLELSQIDATEDAEIAEIRVRGTASEVQKIQRIIEAMAGKTATRLDAEPGRS